MKILKFTALWCPECAIMKPRWDKVYQELPTVEIEDIDYDKNLELRKQHKIDHVPTFIFLDKGGVEILRLKGLLEVEDLVDHINKYRDR